MYFCIPIYLLLSKARLIFAKLLLEFHQKSYAYRLIKLFDHHLTKQILPINLKNKNKSSKPREQSENTLI